MKKLLLAVAATLIVAAANAQARDTVIVNLAKTSKIIFTIEDPEDLEVLKHYDFQQLFEDVLKKIENKKKGVAVTTDSTNNETAVGQDEGERQNEETVSREDEAEREDESEDDTDNDRNEDRDEHDGDFGHYEEDEDDDENAHYHHRGRWHRTWQAFNFDLGTNNYLSKNKFPSDNEIYAVRPWGSWYVGLASVQRSRLAKKLFLEWGLGMSWYSFKFQDDNVLVQPTDNGVAFSYDTPDAEFKKSKLSVSFVQASLIPVLDFGDHGRKPRFWDGYNNAFRIGFGPYVAYRISSHSKIVYNDGDGRERDKERDSFYLNNFRYGARLQIGYRSTDLFFNYDLNELFQENKGPELNAFSFGVIF